MTCHPPSKLWTLTLVGVVLSLPLPPPGQSLADSDGEALQLAQPADPPAAGQVSPAPVVAIPAGLEARLLARLRHEIRADVEDLAMQSMERAVRQLRARDLGNKRPLSKGLRLTFELEPSVEGVAPVSVVTRTSSYSAFADTFAAGAGFKFNVVGDLGILGLDGERVSVDFSTLVQFEDAAGGESGSSGGNGSAELAIGVPETLLSVGGRNLVLTVSEIGLQH